MNLRDSTFVPGGIAFQSKLPLDSPYLFVIILSSVLLVLLLILFIRELCKVFPCENSTESCCSCKCDRTRYSSFDDCCGSCAQALDCCERTSLDSCLDSCCPKRGSLDAADLLTCAICCSSSTRTSSQSQTGASCFDCLLSIDGHS